MTDAATNMRLKLPITCIILEVILIILFGTLVEYDHETDARKWHNTSHQDYENDFYFRYPSEWVWGLRSGVKLQSVRVFRFVLFFLLLIYTAYLYCQGDLKNIFWKCTLNLFFQSALKKKEKKAVKSFMTLFKNLLQLQLSCNDLFHPALECIHTCCLNFQSGINLPSFFFFFFTHASM